MIGPIQTVPRDQDPFQAGGAATLDSVAQRREVLYPRTVEHVRPAVFLAGQLDRVTGTLPGFDLASVLRSAVATTMALGPTVAYFIRNAVVRDGSVYAGAYRHFVTAPDPLSQRRGNGPAAVPHFSRRALVSSYMGHKYFGHWLRDECPQYLLAERFAPPLCLSRAPYRDEAAYADWFGQDWTTTDQACIDEIVIFQDHASNPHKRRRTRALRSRLQARFAPAGRSRPVYLRRGRTGAPRRIANEDELIAALIGHGFVVADLENEPLSSIIVSLLAADLVVSIEGSHLAHCAFTCGDGAGLLVLQPSGRFSLNHREWAAPQGLDFGFVVGERAAEAERFSLADILRTAERMFDSSASAGLRAPLQPALSGPDQP